MLELKNIHYSYKNSGLFSQSENKVLNDVSVSLESGKSLGILGISGSGKSTLAKIIAGIYKPNNGEVVFCGKKAVVNKDYMQNIQIVFQDSRASFNPDFSVYDAISEPMVNAGFDSKKIDEKITELFKRVCLDESILHKKCSMLSGGMLQRLSIARAMALNPKIIILDEATSSLDVVVAAEILKMLKSLQNEFSYIVITHDLRLVKLFCDEVIVLDGGVVAERQHVTKELNLTSDIGVKLSNAILKPYPKGYSKQ